MAKLNRLTTSCLLAGAFAPAAVAAQGNVNPLPPTGPAASAPGENVFVGQIQRTYGISKREAEERVQVQGEIAALLENPAFSEDPNFAGVVVQKRPVYQVFLLYDDNDAKSDLLRLVPPTLRKYVKIRKTRFAKGKVESGEREIQRALEAGGIRAVVDYDKRDDVFVVQAPGVTADAVRALVPAEYQAAFRHDTAPFAVPEQAYTTGATSGRAAYAGYVLVPSCTLAFPVTYTYGGVNRQGVLSAGHCFEAGEQKYLDWGGGVRTTFATPVWRLSQNSIDVAFLDTTNMTTGYWLNYDNPAVNNYGYRNQVGGFNSPQGWLRTKNFIRASSSWVGMDVCKQGRTTSLTCAEVTSTSYPYTYFGPSGQYVRVSNSSQSELSAGGDSGGPWFTATTVSTTDEVSAVGIHITGAGAGTSAYAFYMPIDRVFSLPNGPTNVRLFTTP